MNKLATTTQIKLSIVAKDLWEYLTNPTLTTKYLFNCAVNCNWQVGSDITWEGTYNDQKVFQKGKLLAYDKNKSLKYTTIDPGSKYNDEAIHIIHVNYQVEQLGDDCQLTVQSATFDGDEERLEHIRQGWDMALSNLQKLI